MRKVVISLPDTLYGELCEVSAAMNEPGYGPASFATDLVASELAARRLSKIPEARYGARITTESLERYRVLQPREA